MHKCHVHLFQTGVRSRSGLPVGNSFVSCLAHVCTKTSHDVWHMCCVKHATFCRIAGYYNQKLARGIFKAASRFQFSVGAEF